VRNVEYIQNFSGAALLLVHLIYLICLFLIV